MEGAERIHLDPICCPELPPPYFQASSLELHLNGLNSSRHCSHGEFHVVVKTDIVGILAGPLIHFVARVAILLFLLVAMMVLRTISCVTHFLCLQKSLLEFIVLCPTIVVDRGLFTQPFIWVVEEPMVLPESLGIGHPSISVNHRVGFSFDCELFRRKSKPNSNIHYLLFFGGLDCNPILEFVYHTLIEFVGYLSSSSIPISSLVTGPTPYLLPASPSAPPASNIMVVPPTILPTAVPCVMSPMNYLRLG